MLLRRTHALLAVLVLSAALTGCGGDTDTPASGSAGTPAAESGPVRIGAVLGISGRFAFVGAPQQQALQLAQDQINADGGIDGRNVEFVIYDDEVDETKTVPLANRLISEDKVVALIGPSITVPALALQPVIERSGIPNITLTSKAIWEQGKSEFIFQTTPREEIEVKSILSFIQDELAAKKVAVIFDRQPYGTGNLAFIKKFAADFGIEIVAEEGIENNDTNADAQVNRVKNSGATAVIVWVGDPAASSVAKALEQAQVTVPVIGSSAIAGPRFPELAGPAGEGIYSNGTLNYANPPANQTRFLTEFQERFDSPPTQFAAFAYDAAFVLKAAIEEAGSTEGEAIAKGLLDMSPYEGVVATYDFEEDNHNGIPNEPLFYIVQVKSGQYQVVHDTRE